MYVCTYLYVEETKSQKLTKSIRSEDERKGEREKLCVCVCVRERERESDGIRVG
jgi:hypothetical protein